jgi:hypothetical protein
LDACPHISCNFEMEQFSKGDGKDPLILFLAKFKFVKECGHGIFTIFMGIRLPEILLFDRSKVVRVEISQIERGIDPVR